LKETETGQNTPGTLKQLGTGRHSGLGGEGRAGKIVTPLPVGGVKNLRNKRRREIRERRREKRQEKALGDLTTNENFRNPGREETKAVRGKDTALSVAKGEKGERKKMSKRCLDWCSLT